MARLPRLHHTTKSFRAAWHALESGIVYVGWGEILADLEFLLRFRDAVIYSTWINHHSARRDLVFDAAVDCEVLLAIIEARSCKSIYGAAIAQ